MSREVLLLLVLNFFFIGALPQIFFRKGRLAPMWWLAALPLFAAPITAILMYTGVLQGVMMDHRVRSVLQLVAVVLSASSIALIALTIGSNRVPLALWHQKDDAPQSIVTFGAYRHVRHPFYVAFIIATAAVALYAPHVVTLLLLIYTFVVLNLTAAGEEKRLSVSAFGEEYRQYMSRTGRFVPRWKQNA